MSENDTQDPAAKAPGKLERPRNGALTQAHLHAVLHGRPPWEQPKPARAPARKGAAK